MEAITHPSHVQYAYTASIEVEMGLVTLVSGMVLVSGIGLV